MTNKWITLPRVEGEASRQAHADLPAGTYERELGREGFSGPSTQMHHRHAPTGWSAFSGPLKPRAFDTVKLSEHTASPFQATMFFSNAHVRFRFWRVRQKMDHLARNSDGDELIFVHAGNAQLFCDYGHLGLSEGDYVMLPRGTMWRIEPESSMALLLIEATNDSYKIPEKGIVGAHAIFDPAVLDVPKIDDAFRAQQKEDEWRIVVKRRNTLSTIVYPFNPLDAVGWHGTLMPLKLNWRAIRPLMSHRAHIPPSAHTTFAASRFMVSTFVPRPLESDPGALKVPFFHNNDDYDEVIFYHQGSFFSRDNIHPGMVSFHPAGFTHGPHPNALANQGSRAETDEVAVMLDARDALDVAPLAEGVEWPGYVDSWRETSD
jgi:homogentisate 1,2-dioxygenase